MKFQFVGNACGVFQGSQGTRILIDPWLNDGVFEGSWCHSPPISTTIEDLLPIDAVFLSHIHPDHFDDRFFHFPLSTPIFVLDLAPNFLEKKLRSIGFSDIRTLREGVEFQFFEFTLVLFGPFAKHNFHPANVGNIIDSALVLRDGHEIILNANDNTPTPAACEKLRTRFGKFDLAMLNYNAAGPYPSCFRNLDQTEKFDEHQRILDRNFHYLLDLLSVLKPRACLPFAGSYLLGGKEMWKNPFLGTTSWDNCGDFLRSKQKDVEIVLLREGDELDVGDLTSSRPYLPIEATESAEVHDAYLSEIKYPYEFDPLPDNQRLLSDLKAASEAMLKRCSALELRSEFSVSIDVGGVRAQIYPTFGLNQSEKAPHLNCYLDLRLLRRILDRKAQWNSAEIGCHIEFDRRPNTYEPDLHTALQFLHL